MSEHTLPSKQSVMLAALALLVVAVAPATAALGGGAVSGETQHSPEVSTPASTPTLATPANNTTTAPTNNTTANATASGSGGTPTLATQARIFAVKFDEAHLSVTVRKSGQVYATSGPFALFTVTEQLKAAHIKQQRASAQVLQGGNQVRVTYQDNAAPVGSESLYTLTLFFEDGSKRTLKLYASKTGVSVAASQLQKYRPFIEDMRELAAKLGYKKTPEGLDAMVENLRQKANIVDGFLIHYAAEFLGLLIAFGMNPVSWGVVVVLVVVVLGYIARKFGDMLTSLQNTISRAEQVVMQHIQEYRNSMASADRADLDDVPEIGSDATIYEAVLDVNSPKQLARMASRGAFIKNEDGELIRVHNGLDDVDVDAPRDSWLEPLLRNGRFDDPYTVLDHVHATCQYLGAEYGLGEQFAETREQAEAMKNELDARRNGRHDYAGDSNTGGGMSGTGSSGGFMSGSGAGGDD